MMEDTSNGKVEESPKIETHDGEKKQETVEGAADLKSKVESTGGVADDAGVGEKDPQPENSETPEDEKLVTDFTLVPVEKAASSSKEESIENVEEKPSEVAELEPDAPPSLTDVASDGLKEETAQQPSVEDSEAAIQFEPRGIEGEVDVSSRGLDQKEVPVSDFAAREHRDDSTLSSEKAAAVQAGDYSHQEATNLQSTGIPPIVPLTQQTLQRTSWKSCCGLFEILWRSDR